MEPKFEKLVILSGAKDLARFFAPLRMTFLGGVLFLNNIPLHADTVQNKKPQPLNENTADSLEMIAERMKALSGSLSAMPEPPRLNQVIQIPEGFEKTETEKE